MVRLWARMIKKHRIIRSETVELTEDIHQAIGELCAVMDISRPMFLGKHQREWEHFQQTSFTGEHFVEPVFFDKLEIERIDSEAPKKKSKDPRNG